MSSSVSSSMSTSISMSGSMSGSLISAHFAPSFFKFVSFFEPDFGSLDESIFFGDKVWVRSLVDPHFGQIAGVLLRS